MVASLLPPRLATAQLDSCVANISPDTTNTNTETDFSVGISNSNSNPITWLQVTSPGAQYVSLESGGAAGWQADATNTVVTFSQGQLDPGFSQGFDVQGTTGSAVGAPGNWQVAVSDNADGSNAIICSGGDTSLQLQSNPSQINIFGIGVSSIGPNSVTVSWQTDIASATEVSYGLDQNLGQSTPTDNTLVVSHSVKLAGLTANTGYDFTVTSTTPADGGTSTSGINSFLTALQPPPAPPPIIIINLGGPTTGTIPGVTVQSTPTEHVPPTIALTSDFSKPFKTAPAITGTATDNVAVARVDYSTDGGRDWLPVDQVKSPNGGRTATLSFTPILPDDGNYQIEARATDSSGNTATTSPATLIIDRLPPQVGPLAVAFGPETLTPDAAGFMHLVPGNRYHLSTSAVGGPVSIMLTAQPIGGNSIAGSTFALTRDSSSGLWNGLLTVNTPGTYQLVANSVDGANNRTTRHILNLSVDVPGRVTSRTSTQPLAAKLTLYYLEPSTNTWHVWAAAPYGETNPQTTSATGAYDLMVPKGEYYLRASAPHYSTFTSTIFTVSQPQAITAAISLIGRPHIGSLYVPDLPWSAQTLPIPRTGTTPASQTLIGTLLPNFTLPTTAGGTQRGIDLASKPTVISLLTTWSPDSQDQITALSAAQSNHDVNIVPIFSQQDSALVSTYLATGGYNLTADIDSDGTLTAPLQESTVPQHIFVDRTGHIKKVMLGVLSSQELLNQLGGLE